MRDGILEVIYYRNCHGAVSVSLDEGETVILPTGRRIPLTPVWEESDEDGLDMLLTPPQVQALAEFRARPPMTELEQMAWDMRKRRLAVAKDYAQPVPEPRKIRESAKVVVSDLKD